MTPKDAHKLIKLNTQFYQQIASDFDDSRQFFWHGWKQLDPFIKSSHIVLDIACGNGRFEQYCRPISPTLRYIGIDNNNTLGSKIIANNSSIFVNQNILDKPWKKDIPTADLVTCFGFAHHIPGVELRSQFFAQLTSLVNPGGYLVISLWNFLKNPALLARIKASPREKYDTVLLEDGDYILDWKRGQEAIRYCHQYSEYEINACFPHDTLQLINRFEADGKNNDNLYLIFKRI